jgi:hypothetical protein
MEVSDEKAMKLADVNMRVLEAMAKLELKQQQEQEESMQAPPKSFFPNPTPALDSHQRKEKEHGITEYVCKGPGFLANIKDRYSDFQVIISVILQYSLFNILIYSLYKRFMK